MHLEAAYRRGATRRTAQRCCGWVPSQIGDANWIIYRSLGGESIRSLLGQQVRAEFLFGKLKADGGCQRLLEIEPLEE